MAVVHYHHGNQPFFSYINDKTIGKDNKLLNSVSAAKMTKTKAFFQTDLKMCKTQQSFFRFGQNHNIQYPKAETKTSLRDLAITIRVHYFNKLISHGVQSLYFCCKLA